MKKLGLIGGLGPEATVYYYNLIIDSFKKENQGRLNYPDIVIYSVNMEFFIGLVKDGSYEEATSYLADKLIALEQTGIDLIAISANTPHLFFDALKKSVSIPMISIVDASARYAKDLGLKNLGLLGTAFTMDAGFFQDVFQKHGITVVTPGETEKKYINTKLFTEIELGVFKDDTRFGIEEIIKQMTEVQHIDGIIMGCTELPLILPEESYFGVKSLNTTDIHVSEIVAAIKD